MKLKLICTDMYVTCVLYHDRSGRSMSHASVGCYKNEVCSIINNVVILHIII